MSSTNRRVSIIQNELKNSSLLMCNNMQIIESQKHEVWKTPPGALSPTFH